LISPLERFLASVKTTSEKNVELLKEETAEILSETKA